MYETSKKLTPAAERALAEAAARRQAAGEGPGDGPGNGAGVGAGEGAAERAGEGETFQAEIGGRKGPDPVRFGDWEKDGIISDF